MDTGVRPARHSTASPTEPGPRTRPFPPINRTMARSRHFRTRASSACAISWMRRRLIPAAASAWLTQAFSTRRRSNRKGLTPIQPWLDEIRGLNEPFRLCASLGACRAQRRWRTVRWRRRAGRPPQRCLHHRSRPVRPRHARPRHYLLNDAKSRLAAGGLSRAPDHDADPRWRDRCGRAGQGDHGVRDEHRERLVEPRRQPRRDQDLQQDDARAARRSSRRASIGRTYLTASGANVDELLVAQPSAIQGHRGARRRDAAARAQGPADRCARSIAYADVLPKAVTDENFAFYGTILNGTPEQEPRWKRAVNFTIGILGDDVSKLYVAKYFPPETKAAATSWSTTSSPRWTGASTSSTGWRRRPRSRRTPSSPPSRRRSAIPRNGAT